MACPTNPLCSTGVLAKTPIWAVDLQLYLGFEAEVVWYHQRLGNASYRYLRWRGPQVGDDAGAPRQPGVVTLSGFPDAPGDGASFSFPMPGDFYVLNRARDGMEISRGQNARAFGVEMASNGTDRSIYMVLDADWKKARFLIVDANQRFKKERVAKDCHWVLITRYLSPSGALLWCPMHGSVPAAGFNESWSFTAEGIQTPVRTQNVDSSTWKRDLYASSPA
jgi:hypothetical protein